MLSVDVAILIHSSTVAIDPRCRLIVTIRHASEQRPEQHSGNPSASVHVNGKPYLAWKFNPVLYMAFKALLSCQLTLFQDSAIRRHHACSTTCSETFPQVAQSLVRANHCRQEPTGCSTSRSLYVSCLYFCRFFALIGMQPLH